MKILLTRRQQLQQQSQQFPNAKEIDSSLSSSAFQDLTENKDAAWIDTTHFKTDDTPVQEILKTLTGDINYTDKSPELDSVEITDTNLESSLLDGSPVEQFGSYPKHRRLSEDHSEIYVRSSKRALVQETERILERTSSCTSTETGPMVQSFPSPLYKDDTFSDTNRYRDEQTQSYSITMHPIQNIQMDSSAYLDDSAKDPIHLACLFSTEDSKSLSTSTSSCPTCTETLVTVGSPRKITHNDKSFDDELKNLNQNQGDRFLQVTRVVQNGGDSCLHKFLEELRKRGLDMIVQDGDGNCLFRAVSLQVYGDSEQHFEIRRKCLNYMEKEKEHFSQFINDEPFSSYILRKRRDGEHGNNLEIQALSELFNRPVEVFVPENGATPINIFHTDYKTTDVPIRLSYHDGNHYNAIVDPLCPTAGLGLGLPGLEPGLADRLQLEQAKDESDKLHVRKVAEETYLTDLNRVIEESKLSANPQCNNKMDIYTQQKLLALSDWEETDADLEQVAIQNSMESFWTMEQNRKQPWNNTHLHRRRSKNYRAGSPSSSFDHQDRTRFVSHSLGYNSTYTDSVRIASVNGSSREPVLSNAPVVSSSYASSSVDSMSGNETHAPHSEFIETPIEYPQTVQELVMNGFELSQVIRAYDLIGDHFDDILNFLLSNKQI